MFRSLIIFLHFNMAKSPRLVPFWRLCMKLTNNPFPCTWQRPLHILRKTILSLLLRLWPKRLLFSFSIWCVSRVSYRSFVFTASFLLYLRFQGVCVTCLCVSLIVFVSSVTWLLCDNLCFQEGLLTSFCFSRLCDRF